MNETCRTDHQPNWDAHPPRGEKPDDPRTGAFRKKHIHHAELPKLELGEVFRRHGVADLIVNNAVEACSHDRKNHDEQKHSELFQHAHKVAFTIPEARLPFDRETCSQMRQTWPKVARPRATLGSV